VWIALPPRWGLRTARMVQLRPPVATDQVGPKMECGAQ
jgi:hypothetical protein